MNPKKINYGESNAIFGGHATGRRHYSYRGKVRQTKKPIIIESQVRIGGGNIWKMVELTTGISQFGYYYDALATKTIDEFRCVPSKCQAMSLSLIPKPGCIKEIKYNELANISEVVLIDLFVKRVTPYHLLLTVQGAKEVYYLQLRI